MFPLWLLFPAFYSHVFCVFSLWIVEKQKGIIGSKSLLSLPVFFQLTHGALWFCVPAPVGGYEVGKAPQPFKLSPSDWVRSSQDPSVRLGSSIQQHWLAALALLVLLQHTEWNTAQSVGEWCQCNAQALKQVFETTKEAKSQSHLIGDGAQFPQQRRFLGVNDIVFRLLPLSQGAAVRRR